MRILVTRPEPGGSQTAERLQRLGHSPVQAPLFDIRINKAVTIPQTHYDGVIITSANGIRGLQQQPDYSRFLDLPCFTVGDRTAQNARQAGFGDVHSAAGNADALRHIILTSCPSGSSLLYVAGADRTGSLDTRLEEHGFHIDLVEVYDTEACPQLYPDVKQKLLHQEIDLILLYSQRAVDQFFKLAKATGCFDALNPVLFICLSASIADDVESYGPFQTLIPDHPNEQALIDRIETL